MGAFFAAFRSKRVGLLLGLGFASGLPLLLSGQTLQAWMTNEGVDLKTVGIFALVSLPYSFKVLWAPLLDRFALPWLGRRRGWIALAQLGVGVALLIMSFADPKAAPLALAAMAVTVAFFSASQDVVTDAYRTDVLPENERASGTATFILGYRVAMLMAGAGALILSDHLPWSRVYQLMGLLMFVGVIATWRAPEPEAVRVPRTLGEAVVRPFVDFFTRRGALLAISFVMLYKFGEYVADGMIIPFLIKTGFSNTDIGALRKGVGFFATVAGVMLGGGLVARFGVRRALLGFGLLQAATNSGYLALAVLGKSYPLLVAAIAIDNLCGGLATAAFSAFLMSLCNKSFSATQFALLSSASTLVGRFFAASSGFLVSAWGWATFFAFTMAVAVPALVLLGLMPGTGPRNQPAPATTAA